jgi:hypothetical protein
MRKFYCHQHRGAALAAASGATAATTAAAAAPTRAPLIWSG